MITLDYEHHDEIVSTNTRALQYAREGRPEGLVISADFQTEGRGKPGNVWVSPKGKNLLFSVLLRPPLRANKAPMLTLEACQAVKIVLESGFALSAAIKKPNDVMIKGRKICGILTESLSTAGGNVEAVVIGFGLNVNASAAELPPHATSLLIETGHPVDRAPLLHLLAGQLVKSLEPYYAPCT